ncbi:hypothetical protein QN277_006270 [Acacia crassicarpa]|uniref:Uncharacterized protein n=1 Tax=Acacia crassicarpa TaxID=499986 RepID=A0AAE1IT84_9FABA|nr:hypothetical protein QN277_006270 [Acacia crassicarpa]
MGSRVVLGDKETTKSHSRKHDCGKARGYNLLSSQQEGPKCKEKMIEFMCSCCLLCVCCPLSVVCCIKLPCKICHQAMRRAWHWGCSGSRHRSSADYSSFSDIDSEVSFGKVKSGVRKD